ncbi:sigma-54-dependent transcriptional regulator [Desulfolutivibrio sulfoxidireducens]|uniref:sigma-54-dependent transcriptional regulator n=1 Tax=Desulfolutivibrio sulfoxidireducens TaxID=2773299 RepID=UPI00159EA659|nr:sigma-54 dependent transcriptional regulator [Desulfolutivibrio sulfoxidireducens]QLA15913.1 response regulator [Desulfolutivibrio sulfoxidireducens]QLA20185.1 response regulator [Desulfolutivibrio sulfoxidireducens]
MRPRILVVDDDPGHLSMLTTVLSGWGYLVEGAANGAAALAALRKNPRDLVLTDVRMAGMDGIEVLKAVKDYNPAVPVLIMTAYSSVETAVDALKAGAYDYLIKPLDLDVLRLTMDRALDHLRLRTENRALRERLGREFTSSEIIGQSPPMRELLDMAAMAAPTEATVLITGESGTGKELVARAIHANSPRKNGPLVTVNCAALPETLLESELFGHEKGAFTGADRRREGRFMTADKGTIFLDEIGEMSPATQVKLLRVIQEREIERVGGDRPIGVDVRILAATNRDLKKEVAEGGFREDLYYRLNVLVLSMPPLRRRREDIPLLARHFLEKFAKKNRKTVRDFSPGAMEAFLRHDWPGNVRELENAVERGVILAIGEYLTERELPPGVAAALAAQATLPAPPDAVAPPDLAGQALEDIEQRAILATLKETGGNKSEAARVLGITRATLHKKLKKYGEEESRPEEC